MHDKIMKLLRLAESQNDNEAISAFRHARIIMNKSGIDWTNLAQDNSAKYDLIKLMQQKLQLQKEVYDLQDKITLYKKELEKVERSYFSKKEVDQGYSEKSDISKYDIDEAFKKIFDSMNRYGPKKNDFLKSLKDQWDEKGWLSPKQVSRLRENFVRYTGFEPAW